MGQINHNDNNNDYIILHDPVCNLEYFITDQEQVWISEANTY